MQVNEWPPHCRCSATRASSTYGEHAGDSMTHAPSRSTAALSLSLAQPLTQKPNHSLTKPFFLFLLCALGRRLTRSYRRRMHGCLTRQGQAKANHAVRSTAGLPYCSPPLLCTACLFAPGKCETEAPGSSGTVRLPPAPWPAGSLVPTSQILCPALLCNGRQAASPGQPPPLCRES